MVNILFNSKRLVEKAEKVEKVVKLSLGKIKNNLNLNLLEVDYKYSLV
jgi:hypothetical protein